MNKSKDITGRRFGRWSVIKRAKNNAGGTAQWLCRCSCGTERVVRGTELRYGASTSCGCYNREISRNVCIERNFKHGMSKSREHRIWKSMTQRCYNPKAPSYKQYGARGITICKRWRESFAAFLQDMGRCKPDESIDRKNNDGPYCKRNCRWASYVQQCSNTRRSKFIQFNGVRHTQAEWSRKTKIPPMTIIMRLRRGWSVKRTLTTPTGRKSSIPH